MVGVVAPLLDVVTAVPDRAALLALVAALGRRDGAPPLSDQALTRLASDEVRHFAGHVIAERGLQHGQLIVLPIDETAPHHHHQETGSDAA